MTDATELDLEAPSTPLSNAERQRRYRERHGKGDGNPELKAEVNPQDKAQDSATSESVMAPRNESQNHSNDKAASVTILCAQQDEVYITFDDDGAAVITQRRWPDEDQIIIISRENLDTFIDRITDAFGIPSFGRP